ncbi:hypothetical protein PN410_00460 [Halorubrum ezzemoulense]|nr:hypothetical protein [Halorubrum ezzemoulense]
MSDDTDFDAVMDRTESDGTVRGDLDVRIEEREQRRAGPGPSFGDAPTTHRFFVVDLYAEEVLHEGAWTTPDSHHVTYAEARASAYGYRSGLIDGIEMAEGPSA